MLGRRSYDCDYQGIRQQMKPQKKFSVFTEFIVFTETVAQSPVTPSLWAEAFADKSRTSAIVH